MTKLGQLREAEENARLEIEKAEKEAQRIRLSLPDLLEEKSRENRDRLSKIRIKDEEAVDREVSELAGRLEEDTEIKLRELAAKEEELHEAASARLRNFILRSGEENP
jgi:hypothetical protein